jgi:NAD(P)H-hydrate epimerase
MLRIKFPKRRPDTHKGDYGRALIVAGSPGMIGAAVLASRGALRVGAGLTYLAVPKELVNFVNCMTPEVITLPFEKIKTIKPDAIAIGPGLGQSPNIKKILHKLVISHSSLVIDADALNVLSNNLGLLKKQKACIILTPHPGEMSRLIDKSVEYIQKNRVAVAKEAAKRFNCLVVLKGNKTVIAKPSGETFVNRTGNPGMATGGVGDVLTGMIAGLLAQGFSPWNAAVAGVYLHGLAGDLAAKEKGEYGMIASDLVEKIPHAIQKVC